MNKNELKEGEIYTHSNSNIVKIATIHKKNICGQYIGGDFQELYSNNGGNFNTDLRVSTPEEKHWLETCIKADKFIKFEEAMKSFIPEYVECIKEENDKYFYGKLGTIYKVSNWIHSFSDCMLEGTTSGSTDRKRFKPSTKEAYDAQFKIKEIIKVKPFEILSFFDKQTKLKLELQKNKKYKNINTNIEITICLSTIEYHKKYEIQSVINEEGNIFMIGDIITPTITDSPNKGKGFKIIGFRLNKAKTMICAITNVHSNGVGIDKIEHFIEKEIEKPIKSILEQWLEKTKALNLSLKELITYIGSDVTCDYFVIYKNLNGYLSRDKAKILFDEWNKEVVIEETLLEKAKRLYPVGTKFKCANGNDINRGENFSIIENYDNKPRFQGDYLHSENSWIVHNGQWAEIIEDEPKVGDKFKFKQHHRGNFIIDSIKDSTDGKIIFYNQHEKYNKNHNRVLLKNITIIK